MAKKKEVASSRDIQIIDVVFASEDGGEKISEYGAALYSSDMKTLHIKTYYNGVIDKSKKIALDWKLILGENEFVVFEASIEQTVYAGDKNSFDLSFGYWDVGMFEAGKYKFELWHHNKQLFSKDFEISEQSGAVKTGNVTHECVDLGLSMKWATCNVGASTPEEYGDYFAWGDTSPRDLFSWGFYKFRLTGNRGTDVTFNKYVENSGCGNIDNKTRLEMDDDAARVHWGENWRMPTKEEFKELRDKCTWLWTTVNGVGGYKVVSQSNGNSIFLPAAGIRANSGGESAGSVGFYWSASLGEISPTAWNLAFDEVHRGEKLTYRYWGLPVRPVCPFEICEERPGGAASLLVNDATSVSTTFLEEGGSVTYSVSTNDSWSTCDVPDWCIVEKKTSQTLTLRCDANTSSSERTGCIKIKSGGQEVRINIRQQAVNSLREGRFENVYVENDVSENGIKGKKIHVRFFTKNCGGDKCFCQAIFWYKTEHGMEMLVNENAPDEYKTNQNVVMVAREFTMVKEDSSYGSLTLFIPESAYHVTAFEELNCYFDLILWDSTISKKLDSGEVAFE